MPNAALGDSGTRGGKGGGGGKGGSNVNSGKGGGSRSRPGDWPCFLCGFQTNREFRNRCFSCEALRSASMEQAFGAYAQKQLQQQRQAQNQQPQRQAKKGSGGGGSNGGNGNPSTSASAECRELRERLEKLQSELAATKALAARGGAATGAEDEDETMEDGGENDYSAWTEEERAKRLELARGGLAYAAACHGEDSPQAVELRDTIASIQKASREAKPFKAHRNQLERRREELRRRQERDEATVNKTQEEIDELQSKLATLKTNMEERAKAIADVTEELNELVLRTLAEEGGGGGDEKKQAGQQAGAPWAAVSTALQGLAGHAGLPADVAALLAQVKQIADACAKAAADASPPNRANAQSPADGAPASEGGVAERAQPTVLAPQWRRGKAAEKPPSAQARAHLAEPVAAAAVSASSGTAAAAAAGEAVRRAGGGADGDGGATGTCTTASPAGGGAAAAATAATATAAAAAAASDEELVEAMDDHAMQVDIEESIAKLPDRDQRRLRAALRLGGGGGQAADGGGDEEGAGTRRQDRERSPRPTRAGEKES